MHITRRFIQDSPDTLFVFGDNVMGKGMRGQALEARGEKNAVGLPTKWQPRLDKTAFFYDVQFDKIKPILDDVFDRLLMFKSCGKKIMFFPKIGEGLARMHITAPKTLKYIKQRIKEVEESKVVRKKLVCGANLR